MFSVAATPHGHEWVDKKKLVARARRMDGQAAAIGRMIEGDRPCHDVLQQIVALIAAAEEVAVLLIEDHVVARCRADEAARLAEELGGYLRRVCRR